MIDLKGAVISADQFAAIMQTVQSALEKGEHIAVDLQGAVIGEN